MTDDNLEEKRRKMYESQAKVRELIHRYRTDEGTVFRLPDFSDPAVCQVHMSALEDAYNYFSAAKHYKRVTTYRFETNKQIQVPASGEGGGEI